MDRHSEIVLFYDGLWYLDQSCQVQNLFQYPPLHTKGTIKLVAFPLENLASPSKVYDSANLAVIYLLSSLKVNDIAALMREYLPICEIPLCFGHD